MRVCHREPHFERVVGLEGAGVVGVADDADENEQGLAFDQRAFGGEPVDLGQLVPQRAIAPERRRDGSQRVAGLHRVNAPARTLLVGIDRIVSEIEIGERGARGRAIAKRAGTLGWPRAPRESALQCSSRAGCFF